MLKFFYLSFIAISLFSCNVIEPLAPGNSLARVPKLDPIVSRVSIPIELDLNTVLATAEKTVPKTYHGKQEQCEGLSIYYDVTRDKIEFNGQSNYLNYNVHGALGLKLSYCPKCHHLLDVNGDCIIPRVVVSCGDGEPMRRFSLNYSTSLNFTPQYKLNTKTVLKSFNLLDPCSFTIAHIDATSKVENEIKKQLINLQSEIDHQLQLIDIKSNISKAWNEIQFPIKVDGYGFLFLSPSALYMNQINLNGKVAFFTIEMDVSPQFTSEKPIINKLKLPPLGVSSNRKSLSFGMDVMLTYDSLSSILRKNLVGDTIRFKRKIICIKDIAIYGSKDERIILKLSFSGSKKGTVFFIAQPKLNEYEERIELQNLDFDIETKSLLLKSAKWFLHSKIIDAIQRKGNLDYSHALKNLKTKINASLNNEVSTDLRLQGKIATIELKQLFFSSGNIVLRTSLEGELKLILK